MVEAGPSLGNCAAVTEEYWWAVSKHPITPAPRIRELFMMKVDAVFRPSLESKR